MENQETSTTKDKEISLLDLFAVLLRHKFFIIGVTVAGMIFAIVFSVITIKLPPEKSPMPNTYQPRAVMLIAESGSGSSLPAGASSLASLAGISLGAGGSSNASLAQYLATSNLLLDAVNEEFDFTTRFKIEKSPVAYTRKALKEALGSDYDDSNGIFTISFKSIDPVLAQQVVNFCVDWLKDKFEELGLDNNLLQKQNLEKNMDATYQEILKLQQQTQQLGYDLNKGSGIWSIPNASIETQKIQMELNAQQQVYTQLKSQYELLKVQMQSEQPVFQILERPEVPDLKSGPSRGKLCIIITFACIFVSIFLSFLFEAISGIKSDPEAIAKLKGKK